MVLAGKGAATGRFAVSDNLTKSALGARSSSKLPVRETAILMTLFNHPRLIEDDFETVVDLELEHPDLKRFHAAMLDAMAEHHVSSGAEMRKAIADQGLATLVEALEAIIRRNREWSASAEAAEEDAREALRQAIHLHQRARALHKELELARVALGADATEENFNRLLDIQNDIRNAQATEALIEGFGIPSGRSAKGF